MRLPFLMGIKVKERGICLAGEGEPVKGLKEGVVFGSYKDHAGCRWRLLDWRAVNGGWRPIRGF